MNPIQEHYLALSLEQALPVSHRKYLEKLKSNGFEPKVIYDIGSCVRHWENVAKELWPNALIIMFDANFNCEFLYKGSEYWIGVLSSVSGSRIKFYLNEYSPGGASYYREIGDKNSSLLYRDDSFIWMQTMRLDDVVELKSFPPPDLVKIDVQGSEYDILQGGIMTISKCKHLIMELPKEGVKYNLNAPDARETDQLARYMGFKCDAPLFSDNGLYDGDWGYIKN